MNIGEDYARKVSRIVLGRICHTLGWHGINTGPMNILVDLLKLSIQKLGRESLRNAELRNRCKVDISDVEWTLSRCYGQALEDAEDFLGVDFGGSSLEVPLFPKPSEDDLNFLKPGSREVLRRGLHIQDYLPPMYPDQEDGRDPSDHLLLDHASDNKSPESSTSHGRDLREISSVIMTSAGFISPARQGKLPDARHPSVPLHEPIKNEQKSPIRSPPRPPPPPSTTQPSTTLAQEEKKEIKEEKIQSDANNSKKLTVFQKLAKPKPPEEPRLPPPLPPPTPSSLPPPPAKKDGLTSKKEDHIDEVMNSVIEKGIAEAKTISKIKKRKKEAEEKITTFTGKTTVSSSITPPTKAKKPKVMVPPPLALVPDPPVSNKSYQAPPKLPSPPTKPSAPLLPPPIVVPPPPVNVEPPKTSKKKELEPKLVIPPPDFVQLGKHEDLPFSNPLIPRGQLYGFGPPVPELTKEERKEKKKEKDKEKKKHKKDKLRDKEEKKEKKKKKDKDKNKYAENTLLVPDKTTSIFQSSSSESHQPMSSGNSSSHPKIKIKEIKHEKSTPSSSLSSAPVVKESKSSKISSLTKPPKLIFKPPKDSHDAPPKKPKLEKKEFLASSSSSFASSSKSEKKNKKSSKAKEDADVSMGMITTQTVGHYVDAEGNQIWICPACGKQDDGSPMIGCDKCDDWYHWACVGISAEPAENQDWYCTRCMAKKTNFLDKKGKKKH